MEFMSALKEPPSIKIWVGTFKLIEVIDTRGGVAKHLNSKKVVRKNYTLTLEFLQF